MAKQFRIYQGQPGSGWFRSIPPSPTQIQEITTAVNAKKIATSIPSPFARIDLVKTAFREVSETTIYGITNSHKLVSDALDVAQLFFYFENVKNKYPNAKILVWDPNTNKQDLIKNPSTSIYGKTLELFWNQDANVYNFNQVRFLYILSINNTIVGGTSPATLFFAAPGVDPGMVNLTFGNVRMFDQNYESLTERDDDFIRFMFALAAQPNFPIYFKEVYDYLQVCLVELQQRNETLWNEIHQYDGSILLGKFKQLSIGGTFVEVLDIPVCTNQINTDFADKSGFTIRSSKDIQIKPLVLPVGHFNKKWLYTTALWDRNTQVPESDPMPVSSRTLPGQPVQYPYLTIGDFLEETLIKVPFELNTKSFKTLGFKKYLAPLKPLIFDYFTIDEIINNNMLTVNEDLAGGGVSVKLSIPTSKGEITYTRIYQGESIADRDFDAGIYPLVKAEDTVARIDYHIGLIDNEQFKNLSLEFRKGNNSIIRINEKSSRVRSPKNGDTRFAVKQYLLKENPDYLVLKDEQGLSGMIIPAYKKVNPGSQEASVAIDFGTTNTHIEYKYGAGLEHPFEVSDLFASVLVSKTDHARWHTYFRTFTSNLYPDRIGKNAICHFPTRSALAENYNIKQDSTTTSFLDSNVAYYYERQSIRPYLKVRTNFKWGDMSDEINKNRVKQFLEQLVEGVRNKLLAESISPANLNLTWLYPVSMTQFQRDQLTQLWEKIVTEKLGTIAHLRSLPESIAPFLYHASQEGLVGLTASIDIGGGSSDISVFEKDIPMIISSVNFGGNAIFGDGYNNSIRNNGFVKTFENVFRKECKTLERTDYLDMLNQIMRGENPSSSNFSNFLFSVPEKDFNYTERLAHNSRIKFLFILFYASQAYYLANLMNKKGFNIPKNIILSGNGSRTMFILDPHLKSTENSLTRIKEIFEYVFASVYEGEKPVNIKIIPADPPKEITSKGALADKKNYDNVPTGFWLGGTVPAYNTLIDSTNNQSLTYNSVDDELKKDIIRSVNRFYDVLDNYLQKEDLNDKFGIDYDVFEIFRNIRSEQLSEYLEKGISQKITEAGTGKKHLTESLFFYPLVGILNALGVELSQNLI